MSTDDQHKMPDETGSVLEGLEREMRKWATMDGGSWLQQPAVTPVNLTASQGAAIVAELDRLRAVAVEYGAEAKSAINALDVDDKELAMIMEELGADMVAGEGIGSAAVRVLQARQERIASIAVELNRHARENTELRRFLSESRTTLYNLSFAMRDHLRQVGCGETDNMSAYIAEADKLVATLTAQVSGLAAHPPLPTEEKSSEDLGTSVSIGNLLTGDSSIESAYVLVPAQVIGAIARDMEKLVQTGAEQQEALNDINDRITAQNDADTLQLGGREALNDIALRIARLRKVQRESAGSKEEAPERAPGDPIVRTVWVASDDERDAVEQVAFAWARSEQDALSSTKLSGKRAVRVVVLAAKERSGS